MTSVKNSFIWNLVLTMANYIFPLITFPYVTRVLGANGLGICEFVDNVINYYVMFSMMGLGIIGVREIASQKDQREGLSQTFISLLAINSITTLIAILVLVVSIYTVPEFSAHKEMMWMGVCKVSFNFLLIEWFYKGIEDFKYITVRSVGVKCLYVAGVFLFVRDADDYPVYYLLLVLMVVGNALINIIHCRKSLTLTFRGITLRKYVKPYFLLGAYMILTSLYTTFNVVYLGFVSGTTQVGYFSLASKLLLMVLSVFSAFTTVMLPRMSIIVSSSNKSGFSIMVRRSFRLLIIFSVPMILGMECFAPLIVRIIGGPEFGQAVVMFRILTPLVFVIGLEQILVIQILMPLKQDKAIFVLSALGAVVGIAMNVLTVRSLQGVGSSLSWLTSEVVIMICALWCVRKYTRDMNWSIRRNQAEIF